MIKKIMKKIRGILVIILVGVVIFLGYQYIQYRNQEVDEIKREAQAQIDQELQKKLLEEKLGNAQIFVDSINNDIAITLLRLEGHLTLSHDKTPQNNKFTEWLINSDIKVYADFTTAYTIETKLIDLKVGDDAVITISYDTDDIILSLIDVHNYRTSTNKSVFGSAYTPSQVAAFEAIARDKVYESTNNENSLKQAQLNLENYFKSLAKSTNVDIKIEAK